jgi:hypothetical protein
MQEFAIMNRCWIYRASTSLLFGMALTGCSAASFGPSLAKVSSTATISATASARMLNSIDRLFVYEDGDHETAIFNAKNQRTGGFKSLEGAIAIDQGGDYYVSPVGCCSNAISI